jgi:hypothetical protein
MIIARKIAPISLDAQRRRAATQCWALIMGMPKFSIYRLNLADISRESAIRESSKQREM